MNLVPKLVYDSIFISLWALPVDVDGYPGPTSLQVGSQKRHSI